MAYTAIRMDDGAERTHGVSLAKMVEGFTVLPGTVTCRFIVQTEIPTGVPFTMNLATDMCADGFTQSICNCTDALHSRRLHLRRE